MRKRQKMFCVLEGPTMYRIFTTHIAWEAQICETYV